MSKMSSLENQMKELASEQKENMFEESFPSGNEDLDDENLENEEESESFFDRILESPKRLAIIGGIAVAVICILVCLISWLGTTNQDDYSHRPTTVQDSKIADGNKTTLETESENNSADELVGKTSEESSFDPVVSSVVNLFRALQMFLIAFGVVAMCSGIAKIVIWNYDDFERRKGISMIMIGILVFALCFFVTRYISMILKG